MDNKILYTQEYNFLWEKENLNKNILFLCLGGSYAYGTNVETSDIDIRGTYRENVKSLLGLNKENITDNYVDNTTDTTLYNSRLLFNLLINNNPNTIEMLGCRGQDYLYMTNLGKLILDNQKLFLSQRTISSFSGYANAQLRRLTNALARDAYSASDKEKHIVGSCKNMLANFKYNHPELPQDFMNLYLENDQVTTDISIEHIPFRQLIGCLNEISTVIKEYDKFTKRNKKKDELHLNKHAMHLVRLYLMGIDILENEKMETYRKKDLDLLMKIRNGVFVKSDGTYSQDFFDIITDCERRYDYAKNNTNLPENPDYKKLDELLYTINTSEIKVI